MRYALPAALEEILLFEAKDGVVPENREHMYTERKRQKNSMIEGYSYGGENLFCREIISKIMSMCRSQSKNPCGLFGK
jgi:hypothetical protein